MSDHSHHTSVDVAIIGGGVAGSALAIALRRQGMEVALVEREPSFRDRIRGEAIHPWGVREINTLEFRPLLEEAGAVALPFWTTYRERTPGEPYAWTTDYPDSPPALSVGHPQLQETLISGAAREGARVFRPATTSPVRTEDGWRLDIEHDGQVTVLRARLLVGADGTNSVTRKLIDAVAKRDPIHHQIAGMLVSGLDLPGDSAHQGYHESGFAMIFPQQDDRARIYYIAPNDINRKLLGRSPMEGFLDRVAECFTDGVLSHAKPAGPMGFFPNADVPASKIAGDRIVMIGDAAGTNDPTQGHGLSLVFRDVRLLRDLLLDDFSSAPAAFGEKRQSYYHVLRVYASWAAPLITDTGDDADALREQVRQAREIDPTAEGFAMLLPKGPDGLVVDDETRRRFYGGHLPGARVRTVPNVPLRQPSMDSEPVD